MRFAELADVGRVIFQKALVFFFVLSLLLLSLYALGNYQDFLDSSQLLLLRILGVSLEAVIFCGAYLVLLIIITAFTRGRFFVGRFIFALFAAVVCAVLLMVLKFLTTWLQGLH